MAKLCFSISCTHWLGALVLSASVCFTALAQDSTAWRATVQAHRDKQYATFRDPEESPLDKQQRRRFRGLHYFAPDITYRVPARFIKTENPVLFRMKTTTTREPEYLKYGEVHFTLQGQDLVLEVYQNPEISRRPGYADYLFIPFTDPTNGHETYDIGRYLEFRIPTSNEMVIDFNLCYNPYCSYRAAFSCPIPPAANQLPIPIRAGEKKFHD